MAHKRGKGPLSSHGERGMGGRKGVFPRGGKKRGRGLPFSRPSACRDVRERGEKKRKAQPFEREEDKGGEKFVRFAGKGASAFSSPKRQSPGFKSRKWSRTVPPGPTAGCQSLQRWERSKRRTGGRFRPWFRYKEKEGNYQSCRTGKKKVTNFTWQLRPKLAGPRKGGGGAVFFFMKEAGREGGKKVWPPARWKSPSHFINPGTKVKRKDQVNVSKSSREGLLSCLGKKGKKSFQDPDWAGDIRRQRKGKKKKGGAPTWGHAAGLRIRKGKTPLFPCQRAQGGGGKWVHFPGSS